MNVYQTIEQRLQSFKIELKDYIYEDPKNGSTLKSKTLKVKNTTLDGISFVAQNISKRTTDQSIIGNKDLEAALSNAKSKKNGLRAFAGQIRKDDLEHTQLQASFLATKGLGFREIFYLPDRIEPAIDVHNQILLDQDRRFFDLKFGKMVDSPDLTSIHVDMEADRTSIHLDSEGFVFADRDGKIYFSSTVAQHLVDELFLKDLILGQFGNGSIPTFLKNNVTLFFHINHNSISDPTLGNSDMQYNQFLRYSAVRAIVGVEVSYGTNRIQLFTRGSLNLEMSNDKQRNISSNDLSVVGGLRGRF